MITNAHEGYFAWCTYVSLSSYTFVTISSCRKQSRSTREEKSEPFRFFCPFRAISIGNISRIIALFNKKKKTTTKTLHWLLSVKSFIYQVPSNHEIKSFSDFRSQSNVHSGYETAKSCIKIVELRPPTALYLPCE